MTTLKEIRLDAMISSTSKDLIEHRKQASDALFRRQYFPIVMENLVAMNDADAISASLQMVEDAELYIGIFAHRYGYCPVDDRNPDNISITEMEYRHAQNLGIPTLIFVMTDDYPSLTDLSDLTNKTGIELMEEMQVYFEADSEKKAKFKAFKDELTTKHIVSFFDEPDKLRTEIILALTKHLEEDCRTYYASRSGTAQVKQNQPKQTATGIPELPELYAVPDYSDQNAVFVGRADELAQLQEWVQVESNKPIFVLEAIGGMGKSALAWKWVQDRVTTEDIKGIFWFSFYEGGADMTAFVRYLLAYVTQRNPDDLRSQKIPEMLGELLPILKAQRFLVILDGLERILVAYHRWDAAQMQDADIIGDKVHRSATNPRDRMILRNLTACDASRFLITSRLMPIAFEEPSGYLAGVQHAKLDGLSLSDARLLWEKWKITWTDEHKLDTFFKQLAGHSLLLKLVAGEIAKSPRARGDFDKWYAMRGKELDVFKDLKAKRHHILEAAYRDLSPEAQKTLSQVAALGDSVTMDVLEVFNPFMPQSPDEVDENEEDSVQKAYKVAVEAHEAALAEIDKNQVFDQFDKLLSELEERGLLWWNRAEQVYDLHPVVRGYAFNMLGDSDKPSTFNRIYNYFEGQEKSSKEDKEMTLADLQPYIKMYNALIGAGKHDAAWGIYRHNIVTPLQFYIADYHKTFELLTPFFPEGFNSIPVLSDATNQEGVIFLLLHLLGSLQTQHHVPIPVAYAIKYDVETRKTTSLFDILGIYGVMRLSSNYLSEAKHVMDACHYLREYSGDSEYLWSKFLLLEGYTELQSEDFEQIIGATYNQVMQLDAMFGKLKITNFYMLHRFYMKQDIESLVNQFEDLIQRFPDPAALRGVERIRGEVALRDNQFDDATTHFSNSIRIGNESGVARHETVLSQAHGGLARTYLALGKIEQAARIVEEGCDDYSSAIVSKAQGKHEEAKEYAIKYYTWAWADGEPYVHRWHLNRAIDLLDELSIPKPNLPVFDEANYESFPAEAEVRAYIEQLKQEKEKEAEEAKNQVDDNSSDDFDFDFDDELDN